MPVYAPIDAVPGEYFMWCSHYSASLTIASLVFLGTGAVCGQTSSTNAGPAYPTRPMRLVTTGLGGGADIVARLMTSELANSLGQQVVVDNRSSGVIPGEIVAKAAPDGYTLIIYTNSLWIGHFLRDKTPYDVSRDFAPVSLIDKAPMVLAVHAGLPAKSVKDLLALARARPGELNFGTSTAGSAGHLAGELFKSMGSVNIVRIPYKSNSVRLAELISGQVQMSFSSPGSIASYVKSNRLRALATSGAQPSPLIPGVPTVADSGLPGFEMESFHAVFAPSRTPAAIVNRLNREFALAVRRDDLKEKFLAMGVEPVGSSPQELALKIKAEMARMGKVIKDANIKGDAD